jgi:hypothetical protein
VNVTLAAEKPVNFLAPLFLAGAAAVALPFLFHLIRRSSREKVVFSSLMFLEPSPPRLTKRSRLEHILLLMLRCAVLCLLAFVFARPFFQKPLAADPADDKSLRVALLVDTSASMQREELWQQARGRALNVIRNLKPSDAFALYTFDEQLRTTLSFAETARLGPGERASAAEARLNALKPGWAGTHLGNAMINATEHLLEQLNRDSSDQGNTALRLVVISDFQSGARLDGLQGFEWPKKLEVQLESLSAKELSNAGLQILEENQQLFSALTNTPVRVRLSNSAQARAEQFTLRWRRGSDFLGEPVKAYVPPGQNRIVNLTTAPSEADSLVLSGDQVTFDNAAYLARPKVQPLTIGFFGPDRPDDPNGMLYYLHRAFEQTNLSTKVLAFTNTVPPEAAQSGLLIVAGTPPPAVLDLARTLLQAGKTVMLPLRDSAQANTISALTGGLLVAAPEAQVANYALLARISFDHPLFAPFADARFNDFTKMHFWRYRAVNLANITNATILASFDSGSPMLAEIPVEKGRLLVFATTWMPADSQLALSSKFIPLLFGILEQSAGLQTASHQFNVSQRVLLPAGFKGEVRLPDGSLKAAQEYFSDTRQPGVYSAGDYQFAINLNPSESKIAPLTPDDLKTLGVPLNVTTDARELAAAEHRKQHLLSTETEARQKLWRNFLIAAVVLVLLETWISGRLSRNTVPA